MSSSNTQKISILKFCGERFDGLNATVLANEIHIVDVSPTIEMGDLVVCGKENGAEDVYRVLEPGSYGGQKDAPAGYRMRVHKIPFLSKPGT